MGIYTYTYICIVYRERERDGEKKKYTHCRSGAGGVLRANRQITRINYSGEQSSTESGCMGERRFEGLIIRGSEGY